MAYPLIEQKFKVGDKVSLSPIEYEMSINKVCEYDSMNLPDTAALATALEDGSGWGKWQFNGYYECVWSDETGVHSLNIHQDNISKMAKRQKERVL